MYKNKLIPLFKWRWLRVKIYLADSGTTKGVRMAKSNGTEVTRANIFQFAK